MKKDLYTLSQQTIKNGFKTLKHVFKFLSIKIYNTWKMNLVLKVITEMTTAKSYPFISSRMAAEK